MHNDPPFPGPGEYEKKDSSFIPGVKIGTSKRNSIES